MSYSSMLRSTISLNAISTFEKKSDCSRVLEQQSNWRFEILEPKPNLNFCFCEPEPDNSKYF